MTFYGKLGFARLARSFHEDSQKFSEQKIDHGLINYEPFKKDFYKETTAISKMTDQEVKLYRATELDGVRIRGKNCPKERF